MIPIYGFGTSENVLATNNIGLEYSFKDLHCLYCLALSCAPKQQSDDCQSTALKAIPNVCWSIVDVCYLVVLASISDRKSNFSHFFDSKRLKIFDSFFGWNKRRVLINWYLKHIEYFSFWGQKNSLSTVISYDFYVQCQLAPSSWTECVSGDTLQSNIWIWLAQSTVILRQKSLFNSPSYSLCNAHILES